MGDALPKVNLPGPVQAVAVTGLGTCALLADKSLRCWGSNDFEQIAALGAGTEFLTPQGPIALGVGRSPVALAGGYGHLCALLDNATLKCWGYNLAGELGLGMSTQAEVVAGNALPTVPLP
jgi:hypothetical protein